MTLGICGPVLVLLSLPGSAVIFALLGDRLNLVLALLAGLAAAVATGKAHIPYAGAELHGVATLFAFIAGCEVALIASLGLASIVAPALGRGNWVNGDPDVPPSDLADLTGS
jgi:hypothetical protein